MSATIQSGALPSTIVVVAAERQHDHTFGGDALRAPMHDRRD